MKLLIVSAVFIGVGIWGFRTLYAKPPGGGRDMSSKKVQKSEPVEKRVEKPAETSEPVQRIFTEEFRLWIEGGESSEMWTVDDQYKVGRLCKRGFVKRLRDREVAIEPLEGGPLIFVRVVDKPQPVRPQAIPVPWEEPKYFVADTLPQQYEFQTPSIFGEIMVSK